MKHCFSTFPIALLADAAVSLSFQGSAGEAFGGNNGASVYVDAAMFHHIDGPAGVYCGLEMSTEGDYSSNERDAGTPNAVYCAPSNCTRAR